MMGSQTKQTEDLVDKFNDLGFTPKIQVDEPWTVEKAVQHIPAGAPAEGSSSPLAFFHLLERLKTTKREGWRRFGIKRGESIADHMYRMSLISMCAPPSLAPRLDLNRCMKMCLIHDMAELLVGDITPVDGVAKPEKSRRETTTMDYLTRIVLGGTEARTGEEIRAIWQEYEDSETLESHYVHDIDKLELLLQMTEYERRGEGRLVLEEFAYVAHDIRLAETRAWADDLMAEREAFWAGMEGARSESGGN